MFDFTGKTILVSGASRGLGRAIALGFGRAGAFVCVGYHVRQRDASETLSAIEGQGGSGTLCRFDVRNRTETDQAFREIADQNSGLDVVVNNAGVVGDGLAAALSEAEWNQVLEVNLTGTFNCCRSAASLMMAAKSGVILNVASVANSLHNAGSTR